MENPLLELQEYENLLEALKKAKGPLQAAGTLESQKVHLMHELGEDGGFPWKLVVTYDEQRAKEIYDDFRSFTRQVWLYPAKDLLFYAADIHGNLMTRQRISVLRHLMEDQNGVVVTTMDGLMDHLLPLSCMREQVLHLETGQELDLEAWKIRLAELGYEPNFQASNLATQISRSIGIILPPSPKETYENSFYLETIRGISHYCNAHQYISTIVTGQNEEEILNVVRSMSRSGKVNGFIVLYSRVNDPVIDFLFSEGLLYILIGKPAQYTNHTIYIDNDNLLAGQEATEYLYALGHRKIAYLGVDNSLVFSADRKTGYMTALISHGLTVQPEYCIEVPAASQNEFQELRKLLLSEERPTAVLVSDDILALSLERICMEADISIPEDLSILSFNNSLFARLTSPQLTSIDINSGQLGMEAATQMISHIENPSLPATKIIVPHQLIERDSCRRI